MATARALTIPEIALEIVEGVYAMPVSERRPVLASLALVSRVFHNRAMRLLWADLPSVEPLFQLLSNCVSILDTGGGAWRRAYSLTLNALPPDNEIARFRELAGWVRVLDLQGQGMSWEWPYDRSCGGITMDPPSLWYLATSAGFAGLRVLAVSNVVLGTELRLFNSPLLQALTIYHPESTITDSYCGTLEVAAERFPYLRRLVWKWSPKNVVPPAAHILAATIQPLSVLEGLQDLCIDFGERPVYDNDIALLAGAVPRLLHLRLKFDMDTQKQGPSAQSLLAVAQRCPSLHTLRLVGLFITEADEANVATFPYVGNRLRYLDVADLRCMGESNAAMIIDLLFPFLDIEACRRRAAAAASRPSTGCWLEALDRIGTYHAARE
ncbi:hypothetical protein K466DRAFT_650701 [Polyporus arcularius HHB13444]|uniref:F-box domain-containing protein n=1 Tax=Polyporus arcularius HHB13444 TaxID=1314778 RepID=A0A5C3PVU6_9APHY|nr:hypothetical protein K466DRAFT_650701 [Polyporus arcularius HHB13444]